MLSVKVLGSGSSGNCYLVSNDSTNILLECGIKKKELTFGLVSHGLDISSIDGCLISHEHKDHCLEIQYVDEYTNIYTNNSVYNIYKDNTYNLSFKHPLKPFKIGSVAIMPINVEHGETECYGYIIRDSETCILFVTDFKQFSANLKQFKFDMVMIETNYVEEIINAALDTEHGYKYLRQINTHCSVENAVIHLKAMDLSNCKEIMGVHLSSDVGDKKTIRAIMESEFPNIDISIACKKGGVE